jgi:hypothetical protein
MELVKALQNILNTTLNNTFEYHVSSTDGNISVRIINFYCLFFPPSSHSQVVFFVGRPYVANATFSTSLVVSSVPWLVQLEFKSLNISFVAWSEPSQETEETTRPVENVALTTKGPQERKHNL